MKIVFVCTGNICRSPTAEAVARHFIAEAGLARSITVDSAGTQGYHVGEAPDPRTRQAALKRGYDLSGLRARKLDSADFRRFDLLLAMDRSHLEFMLRLCPEIYRHRVALFMSFAPESDFDEVPDPYYGGPRGFDFVLDMCEAGAKGLIERMTMRV